MTINLWQSYKKNWSNFIKRILEVSQSGVQSQNLGTPIDITGNKIISDSIQNLSLCK